MFEKAFHCPLQLPFRHQIGTALRRVLVQSVRKDWRNHLVEHLDIEVQGRTFRERKAETMSPCGGGGSEAFARPLPGDRRPEVLSSTQSDCVSNLFYPESSG